MTQPTPDAAFANRTFDATLKLIEDVRDYISSGESRLAGPEVTPPSRMRAARDMSRLTNRATAAMSILLLHRALADDQAGDIANIPERLEEMVASMRHLYPADALDGTPLPPPVAALMERADALFTDVARVADGLRGQLDG